MGTKSKAYVMSEAARENQKRAFATRNPEIPDAKRLHGARRQVKKLKTLAIRAIR
jgi:hypothetical protein